MVGATSIYGCGMLGLGMSFSMEQLVIDNDMIGMMRYAKRGIEVNEKTLSVKAIQDVGIGGNFIGFPDTLENLDLPSMPEVLDRSMYDEWMNKGGKWDVDLAHEKVVDILANYEPTPIEHRDLVDAVFKKADERHRQERGL